MADSEEYSVPPTSSLRPKLPGEVVSTEEVADSSQLPINDVSLEGIAVVGALLAIVVFRLLRKKRPDESAAPVKIEQLPPLNLPPKPQRLDAEPAQPLKKSQPAPFDEGSSKHLPEPRAISGTAWVTDGDTIVIDKTQIRLFGIDAPELDHPYGQKAKWAMVKLCKGHTVRAEITDSDDYGRTVAHCTLPDGRDLSAELVKAGLAIDWPKFSGGKYSALEKPGVRKKLWLADARQKGRMHVWEQFEYEQSQTNRTGRKVKNEQK